MLKLSTGMVLMCVLSLSLAGCAYDRSFMQMDSNSGVPFFGLQWAVDSGSRPSTHDDSSILKLGLPDTKSNSSNPRTDRGKADRAVSVPEVVTVSSSQN